MIRRLRELEQWRRVRAAACVAQVLALVGFGLAFPFVPLYLPSLGVPERDVALWAGVLGFASMLPMAIVSPIWGAVGDHYGRKPMVLRALAAGSLTTLLLVLAPSAWALLGVYALVGLFTGVITPLQALVSSVAPRDRIGSSLGLMEATVFIGNAAGPLLGGLLVDRLGFRGASLVGAGLLALGALVAALFVQEDFERPAGAARRVHPLADAREALRTPGMAAIAAVFFLISLGSVVAGPVLPLLAPELDGVPVARGEPQVGSVVGLVLAVAAAAGAVASWQARRLTARFGHRRVLVAAVALTGLLSAPAYLAASVGELVLARALAGLALGAAVPVASAILGLLVPDDHRGAAYGLKGSASALGFALGPLLGGALGSLLGLRPVFLVSAVVLLGAAAVIAATVREPRVRPAAAPAEAAAD